MSQIMIWCLFGAIIWSHYLNQWWPISFVHRNITPHDVVIHWKHFPRYWPFVRGIHRSPVNSPHKGQWRGALMFSLICVWINGWVNNREVGDLRRYRAHYDVIVMLCMCNSQGRGKNRWVNKMFIDSISGLPVISRTKGGLQLTEPLASKWSGNLNWNTNILNWNTNIIIHENVCENMTILCNVLISFHLQFNRSTYQVRCRMAYQGNGA